MIKNSWGLLGPEFLPNSRRTRTLDVGVSVRWFNDRAVPGLGGVWYGKQLLLATLGIAVANEANEPKIRNIRAANAIEALACFLAYEENKWASDPRLRGSSKLQGKGDDLSFKCVSRKNFYVTQPMRMATVRALPSLGLVEANGSRFNAFQCSEISDELIKKACWVYSPYKRSVKDHLVKWVKGEDCRTNSHALRDALSPLEPLSVEARVWLRNLLKRGGNEVREDTQRRKNALTWVDNLSQKPHQEGWDNRPDNIDETHWHDLHAGAKLFSARDAAMEVLDAMEAYIGNQGQGASHYLKDKIPELLLDPLENLKNAANRFLEKNHREQIAKNFCEECIDPDGSKVLRSLVTRDKHVLKLVNDHIRPGPAFRGSALTNSDVVEDEDDSFVTNKDLLPEGISKRMHSLYLLNLDLNGELDKWINNNKASGARQ